MKKVFFQLLIFAFAVSIAAQEKSVNEEIPRITVSNIKWSHKEDWKVTGADGYGTGNPMRPTTMTIQKRNYFAYQTTFKNETDKNIRAFNWDYIFIDKESGKEVSRLEFSHFFRLKKNKRVPTNGFAGPPTRLVDARDSDKNPVELYNISVEIKCVMYEDNTIWRRQGLAENACNELKESVEKREKYLKGRGF